MSKLRDKPLLPLPGLTTLLVGALGLAVGWTVWRSAEMLRQQEDLSRLKDALRDPEATLSERLQSIELWVDDGPASVPELLAELNNPSPEVRAAATTALARIRPIPDEEVVAAVIRSLDDPAPDVRLVAIAGLRGWREHRVRDIQPDVPRLVRSMDDAHATVRDDAFLVVADSRGDPAVGAELTSLTTSERAATRGRAAQLIRDLRAWDENALAAMRRLLQDPDASVRSQAFRTLIASGGFRLEDVLAGLESDDESTIGLACWALDTFGEDGAIATGRLRELLRSGEPSLAVLHALAKIGTPARDAVPEVVALLAEPEEETFHVSDYNSALVRGGALRCLSRISTDESLIVATLRQGLLSPNRWASRYAGQALREFSPKHARESVPALLAALAERYDAGKIPVLTALAGLGLEAAEAAPAIVGLLDQEDQQDSGPSIGSYATEALGRIGPPAADAVPALVAALEAELQREDPGTRQVLALYSIGMRSEIAERILVRFLQKELVLLRRDAPAAATPEQRWDVYSRFNFVTIAVLGLGCVGRGSEAAHQTICQVLRLVQDVHDAAYWDSPRIYWALADLRTQPQETVSLLLEALRRRTIEPETLSAPEPLESSRLPDPRVRIVAIRGLGLFPECADRSVPCLAELLQDEDPRVQVVAALALGNLGEHAREAIPALKELAAAPHARLTAMLQASVRGPSMSPPWIMWSEDSWIDPVHEFETGLAYISPRDAVRSALARMERTRDPALDAAEVTLHETAGSDVGIRSAGATVIPESSGSPDR